MDPRLRRFNPNRELSSALPPTGLWAIASELAPDQLENWMTLAKPAAAWTFRMPRSSDLQALHMLRELREQAPYLAVHGRSDWALTSEADAFIAGARSLPWPALADRLSRPEVEARTNQLCIGASVHDSTEAEAARAHLKARFLLWGPVFDTPSKRGVLDPIEIEGLQSLCQQATPVVAIGGFDTVEQVVAARQAGVHAIAVLRAVTANTLAEMCVAWSETSSPRSR